MQSDLDNDRLRELITAAQISTPAEPAQDVQQPPKPKRTRRRIPVSCGLCHSRKLKCNRQKPCTSCEIRGEGSKCEYATEQRQDNPRPWSNDLNASAPHPHNGWHPYPVHPQYRAPEPPQMIPSKRRLAPSSDVELQQRLDNIERMVAEAASTRQQSSYPTPGDDSPEAQLRAAIQLPPRHSIGTLAKHAAGSTYTGDTAFDGILHELSELKNIYAHGRDEQLNIGDDTMTATQSGSPPTFRSVLAGSHQVSEPQMNELLDALPPKAASDGLLARFFSNDDPAIPVNYVLHQATFMEEYQRHCEDPTHTSIMWLGILFSVLCLSSRFYECEHGSSSGYRAKSLEMSEAFYGRAAQCLAKIDAAEPGPGTVEFNALFMNAAYFQNQENSSRVWMLAGDAVRLAMRMGYHRDAARYATFSPFEIEMRRRLWHFVAQTDLLFSFQLGLPTVVRGAEYDTLPPSNYHEDQLHPAMQEFPPPRPTTEPTRVSYMIANVSILSVFRAIVEHTNNLNPKTYDQVLALDADLRNAHASLPPHLQRHPSPSPNPQSQPTNLTLKQIQLSLFHHKINCILHRSYLTQGLTNSAFSTSTDACVSSALALLACQEEMHRNERELWKQIRWHSFSLTGHDFLLAATILCFYLAAVDKVGGGGGGGGGGREGVNGGGGKGGEKRASKETIEQALDKSLRIWSEVRGTSRDADRAFEILGGMLSHRDASSASASSFQNHQQQQQQHRSPPPHPSTTQPPSTQNDNDPPAEAIDPLLAQQAAQQAQQVFNNNSNNNSNSNTNGSGGGKNQLFGDEDFDLKDFDWAAWDAYFRDEGMGVGGV